MSDITVYKISYKELRDRTYKQFDDQFGVQSFMTDRLRDLLLACPNNRNETQTAMYLALDGNIPVGRFVEFETKIKIDNEIEPAQGGGHLYVVDEYRSKGAGAYLMWEHRISKAYKLGFGCFFSQMVIPIWKKAGYVFFDMPQYITLLKSRPLFSSYGLSGFFLSLCSTVADIPIKTIKLINSIRRKKLLKNFVVTKESIIPNWVEKIATCDGHKYMELHTRDWFQWNLDYNMNGYPGDTQSFYSVYDKDGKPIGFFMTKERFDKESGRYRNIIRGSIVEWGTADPDILNESDLNLLALMTFSPETFHVLTVTTDNGTKRELKKMGFLQHGLFQMSIYDKKKKFPDIYNQDLWRLRYGCGNTIYFGQQTTDY